MASSLTRAEQDYVAELISTVQTPVVAPSTPVVVPSTPVFVPSTPALPKRLDPINPKSTERVDNLTIAKFALVPADASHEEALQILSGDLVKLAQHVDEHIALIWRTLKRTTTTPLAMFDHLPTDASVGSAFKLANIEPAWIERLKTLEERVVDLERVAREYVGNQVLGPVHEADDRFEPSQAQLMRAEFDERFESLHTKLECALSEQQERVNTLEVSGDEQTKHPSQDALDDNIGLANESPPARPVKPLVNRIAVLRNQLIMEPVHVRIGGTAWDAAIFIGVHKTSTFDACVLAFTLVLTWSVQGFFLLILTTSSFTESGLPPIERVNHWRLTEAHSRSHVDPLTHATLVSRVCGSDASLSIANSHVKTLSDVQAYLDDLPLFPFAGGLVMCLVGVSVFAMTVHLHAWKCAALMFAVLELPSNAYTELSVSVSADGQTKLELQSISRSRRLSLFLLNLSQVLGSYVILPLGCLWMSHTIDVGDLVLNTTALAFVLDLDQVIYSSLVPHHVQAEIERIKPLSVNNGYGIFDVFPQIMCAATLCWAIKFSYFHVLQDQAQQMKDIEKTICGGNTSFVFAVVPATNIVMVTNSVPYGRGYNRRQPGYRFLESATQAAVSNQEGMHYWKFHSWNYFESVANDGFVESLLCFDSFANGAQFMPSPIFKLAAARTYNITAHTCSDMELQCDDAYKSTLLRAVCPKVCGCDSPISGMIWRTPHFGCPTLQCSVSRHFQTEIHQLPCKDLDSRDILSSTAWNIPNQVAACTLWRSYIDMFSPTYAPTSSLAAAAALTCRVAGWNRYFAHILENRASRARMKMTSFSFGFNEAALTKFVDSLRLEGCSFLQMLTNRSAETQMVAKELCLGTSRFSSLRAFCPQWCGCAHTMVGPDCPITCNASHGV